MSDAELQALVTEGLIAPAPADPNLAQMELEIAGVHVESAAGLAERDPIGAFALGYDAVRKAISAHMRASGYRVTKGPGHHIRVGRYAVAALDSPGAFDHLAALDGLRLLRNQSQYDGLGVESSEVEELLVHARAMVAIVRQDLT